jgi:hypothetical protein
LVKLLSRKPLNQAPDAERQAIVGLGQMGQSFSDQQFNG